jgi:beta-glucosidase
MSDEQHPTDRHMDPSLAVEDRVDALIEQMTMAEKLAQLGGVWGTSLLISTADGAAAFSPSAAAELIPVGIGHVSRVAGSTGLRPAGVASVLNEIQQWLRERTRLGIPAIVHEEALAGLCARDATQFPQPLGLAATWDRELMGAIARHVSSQMLAVGARQALSPVLDIARDPRWGRVEETFGEDPVVAGELGAAIVRGLQGGISDGVLATAKHFVAHGASDGGLNHGPVHVGARELREVHAEPFAAAIRDGGLASAMPSYASVDGLPPTASRAILTDLLRDELGFTGTVVTDYFAVDLLISPQRVAPNKAVAAAKAVLAGADVELPALDAFGLLGPLAEAGVVPEGVIDLSVRRILRQKFELGLFDEGPLDVTAAAAAFDTPEGRALARRAATQTIVMLSNDGVLPADTNSLRQIAVIGPTAHDPRLLEGDYHHPAHLEILGLDEPRDDGPETGTGTLRCSGQRPSAVTPLDGMKDLAERNGCEVHHERGCGIDDPDRSGIEAAVHLAESADLAVVCLGGRSGLTPDATVGESRDATDLGLTGAQVELLERVHATGTPTIAVVISGRVHTLAEVEQHSDAILLAWVPGREGGAAIADIVFGVVTPSGRLPISLPRNVGQIPVHHGHRAGGDRSQFWGAYTDAPVTPLWPFGYGLSTTTFDYGEPEVIAGSTTDPTRVSVTVTNSGPRDGVEIVQCYVRDEMASVARQDRQLVGFARLPLLAGESRSVSFTVHPSRLAFFDEAMDLVCEPGVFSVELGGCAGSPEATTSFELGGHISGFRQKDIVATTVALT